MRKSILALALMFAAAVLAGLAAVAAGRDRASPSLLRYPYLQNVTPSSITVVWWTDQPSRGRVEYGLWPDYGAATDSPGVEQRHEVTLTGLLPGARYAYRVLANDAPLTGGDAFRTAPTGDETFSFVVLGDSGSGDGNQYGIARLARELAPDLILHTGDLIYPNSNARRYDAKFFVPYADILRTTPLYPSLGNHDVAEDGGAAYLDAFVLPRNTRDGSERYYSFDYGNAHFIAVDAYQPFTPDSAQYQWLAADLAATDRPWCFVFLHPSPYSTGPHGSHLALHNALGPLFERYGVAVVFSGHDHLYERSLPRRDFEPDGRGVVYVVSGGGGASLYHTGQADWVAFNRSAHHVMRVTVSRGNVTLEAVLPDGTVMDSYALTRETADLGAVALPGCGRR